MGTVIRALVALILAGGLALALQPALVLLATGAALGLEAGLVILALGGAAALVLWVRGQADYQRFQIQEHEYTVRLALLLAARRAALPPPVEDTTLTVDVPYYRVERNR